jgi:2-alkyl-3-oxoalkanoate reductase
MSMRVAIVGASGFAGQATTELLLSRGIDAVPLVHSTGNSWGLFTRNIHPRLVDVLDTAQLKDALTGCTHVINCSRGSDEVMIDGLKNLLRCTVDLKISRFVHLSSVAVYGDPPPPQSQFENAPTNPEKGGYGAMKLHQDEIVQTFAKKGLSTIILCPPNIIGPESPYLLQILDTLYAGSFMLADGGGTACNTVDVRNLAHACLLALTANAAGAQRYFVTDDEDVTWTRVISALMKAGDVARGLREGSLEELRIWAKEPDRPQPSLRRSFLHLASGDVRRELRKDPLLEKLDTFVRSIASTFGSRFEGTLRNAISEGKSARPNLEKDETALRLSTQQLRGVRHRCDNAREILGYRPLYTFDQSMKSFGLWLARTRGVGSRDWDLVRKLYGS